MASEQEVEEEVLRRPRRRRWARLLEEVQRGLLPVEGMARVGWESWTKKRRGMGPWEQELEGVHERRKTRKLPEGRTERADDELFAAYFGEDEVDLCMHSQLWTSLRSSRMRPG